MLCFDCVLCAVVPCSDFIMYFNILTGKESLKGT